MKKVLLICFSLLIPCIAPAYTDTDKLVVSDVNKPINWSLAALSSVLRDLYGHHCDVKEPELFVLSEFIYKQKPNATLMNIKNACEQNKDFQKVLFKYMKKGVCPSDGEIRSGFEQKSGPSVGKTSCQYYIENLIQAQNEYVGNYAGTVNGKGGLYVKRHSDKFGGVYEIVDFIHSGNKDKDSSIKVIKDGGNLVGLGIKMAYIETGGGKEEPIFVNVSTSGPTRGIHEKSYIYPRIDLTAPIIKMCRQYGDPVTEVWGDASPWSGDFYPGNTFDIKATFCKEPDERGKKYIGKDVVKNLRVEGQSDSECHNNGVVFDGKMVTLQWLGHFLYGCKAAVADGGAGINSKRYEFAARAAQGLTNNGKKGQANDDGVFKSVQALGKTVGEKALVFANAQTESPAKAINYVKTYMVNTHIVRNKNEITICETTECKSRAGTQDYVFCYVGKKVYHYEFDDICNSSGDKNIPTEAKDE